MFIGDSRVVVLNYSDSETHLMENSNLRMMNGVVSSWMVLKLVSFSGPFACLTNLAFCGGGHSNNPLANW